MLFSSPVFLFLFLPVTILTFYVVPDKFKNTLLFISSLIFYAWGGVSYSIILLTSIILNYIFGLKISSENKRKSNAYLIIGIIANLLILCVFKYTNFIVENISVLKTGLGLKPINDSGIILPIGISFFTFQAISYLVDIYRKEAIVQRKLVNLGLYISLFPQLIAGPIVRYHDIAKQLVKRSFSFRKFSSGVERFLIGLGKKVILANSFAVIADNVFVQHPDEMSSGTAWIGIICYSFQIYFDFSGYSDMAIGLGRMFGFNILENFNFPYISRSIKEFWRRWHISLSTWFRDYLYVPLGGNRVNKRRLYFNLIIVFLLTGFWHGASWTFLFWGAFHGLFLVIERIGFSRVLEKTWKPLQYIYTLLVVIIGWVFFRSDTIAYAFDYCHVLFSFSDNPESSINWIYLLDIQLVVLLIIALLSSGYFFPWVENKVKESTLFTNIVFQLSARFLSLVFLLSILVLSTTYLLSNSYNPFIYFRF